MSMVGELTFFLRSQVKQLKDGIFHSQSKYAREFVKKFGLESSKHSKTPMSTTTKLSKDESRKDVEQKVYRSMIGSLLYLTTSHPNISFSVGAYARYQANLKESHLMSIKIIIRYINGTLDYGLWYPYDYSLMIDEYSDTNWARNVDDKKRKFGACYFIGDCLVAWLSKKQNLISLFTIKVEYVATESCCTQILWMKQMLKDFGIE